MQRLPTVFSGKSREETVRAIREVFGTTKYLHFIQAYVLQHVFKKIHENFMAKSKGGVDEFGGNWKKLSPTTIAQKAYHAQRDKRRTQKPRPLLNTEQDNQWRGIFASQVAKGVPKHEAARLAWAVLKSRGADTILSRYGNADVPINIDTARLHKSLLPGHVVDGHYRPHNKDQLATTHTQGRSTFGTKVPYAKHVNRKRLFLYSAQNTAKWVEQGVLNSLKPILAALKREIK